MRPIDKLIEESDVITSDHIIDQAIKHNTEKAFSALFSPQAESEAGKRLPKEPEFPGVYVDKATSEAYVRTTWGKIKVRPQGGIFVIDEDIYLPKWAEHKKRVNRDLARYTPEPIEIDLSSIYDFPAYDRPGKCGPGTWYAEIAPVMRCGGTHHIAWTKLNKEGKVTSAFSNSFDGILFAPGKTKAASYRYCPWDETTHFSDGHYIYEKSITELTWKSG